jgi:CBS domain-containing protein
MPYAVYVLVAGLGRARCGHSQPAPTGLDVSGTEPLLRHVAAIEDRIMTVRLVYRPGAEAVRPSTTLREAAARMRASGLSCLPVIDGSSLIGIITEHDLVGAVAHGVRTEAAWVFDYTHDGDTWVGLEDDCGTAALKMLAIGCRNLPVVDGAGRVVGMVSMRDVTLTPAAVVRRRTTATHPRLRGTSRFVQCKTPSA